MESDSSLPNFDEILTDLRNIIGQAIASTDKVELIQNYITKLEENRNGCNIAD